jgi:hypothetical protein
MAEATRGDLAYALFEALGLTNTSGGGTFSDAGYLDGITTTLADLGITSGVGGDRFGTSQTATRGETFTMIARALGLAGADTSIEDASAALVAAGIVKGYGNNPDNLGLNDPIEAGHLSKLMERLTPELDAELDDGTTRRSNIQASVDTAADENRAATDPAWSAFLAQQGIRTADIDASIRQRQELYDLDALRRSETYARATDAAIGGTRTDFENRGLYRSGTRMRTEAEKAATIGYQQGEADLTAQRGKATADAADRERQAEIDRETETERTNTDTATAIDDTDESYD